jgi:Cys-tRNA(Pro)/Cys-tRNA(Cys) deacylase
VARKTNALRALDRAGVAYRVHELGPGAGSAIAAAAAIGVPARSLLKSLVVVREDAGSSPGRAALFLVPADRELDLGKAARALGARRVRMARHAEAERLTGLRVGGISPLALVGRRFDVVVDESVAGLAQVFVSAGTPGLDVEIALADLLSLARAELGDASRA